MDAEKRHHPRFSPEGLSAHLIIEPLSTRNSIIIEGNIIDMSYRGIRLKLQHPLQQSFEQAHIRIVFHLPLSGVPLTIHGMIRHLNGDSDCGLQYADHHAEDDLDELMFECIKSVPKFEDEHALAQH